MQRLHYHLLDVFTREPFGGNQLAVFTDAASIAPELMPRIARELNLSETVFVLPPAGLAVARLRIFTPGAELPFAGHPTVGTACLLASTGVIDTAGGMASIIFEEGVGDVHVRVHAAAGDSPSWAQLTAAQPPELRATELTSAPLASLLGVAESDIGADASRSPGPAAVSCGVPFLFIPVRSGDALARCRLNVGAWESHLAQTWAPHVFVYTTATRGRTAARAGTAGDEASIGAGRAQIRGRMFAPAMGIPEDPATGAAATALAGLLAHHAGTDGTHRWTLSQGTEMGRPSSLELEAEVSQGVVTACRVGGHAVIVGRGELLLR
ncbi:MAG: PhzF family phenazine biosynthesis protein [Gemmatimonadaceae bacterium]|nr:PhzF family phenazine biosynthesis protein [Gemmatimonadaceae bacterium]